MSSIVTICNEMNKRTFYKERQINKTCINFLSKQNIKVPLILDMYENTIYINLYTFSVLLLYYIIMLKVFLKFLKSKLLKLLIVQFL